MQLIIYKVETLGVKDAGKCSQNDYAIVDYKKIILSLYVAKFILQFLLVLISVATNIVIFFDIFYLYIKGYLYYNIYILSKCYIACLVIRCCV